MPLDLLVQVAMPLIPEVDMISYSRYCTGDVYLEFIMIFILLFSLSHTHTYTHCIFHVDVNVYLYVNGDVYVRWC